MDPAEGIEDRPIRRREDDPRGPQREGHRARRHDTDPDPVGRLVAAAGHDRRALPQAGRRRRGGRHHAGDRRALEDRRQPGWVDLECADDLGRPGPPGQVEQDRPCAISRINRVVAGQEQPDVILGQQDVGDPGPGLGLVLADPDELGRREAGQGIVAGDLDQPLRPDGLPDQVAFRAGSLVVPEDRRPEHVVGPIEQDGAVHLPGQPDRGDVVGTDPGRGQDRPDRGLRRGPPQGRVLLAPQRLGCREVVLGDADRPDEARLVDQDGLGRGRRDVDAQDEGHGLSAGWQPRSGG